MSESNQGVEMLSGRVRRIHIRAALSVLVLVAVSIGASGSKAALIPTASCFDVVSFDRLSTAPAASYCRGATLAAGYSAGLYTNKSAKQALARLPIDSVFFFAGHSLSAANPAALALMFEYPTPDQSVDALAGSLAAIPLEEGPVAFCDETGTNCRKTTLVTYPWANLLGKYNLVVLEACATAATSGLSPISMASIAHLAGAGTVVGFRDLVGFPVGSAYAYGTKWAGVFWNDLQNGVDYVTATAHAASAVGCCGLSSWVVLQNPAAPKTLRPASYYPHVGNGPAALGNEDPRTLAVERWLGMPIHAARQWVRMDPGAGASVQILVPGTGLIALDAKTLQVEDAIFSSDMESSRPVGDASQTAALRSASTFAHAHYEGFNGLQLRETASFNHGVFSEYRYVWQARANLAWLPSRVVVGVNATTGRVAYYSSQRQRIRPIAWPEIGVGAARRSALSTLGFAGGTVVSGPALEVVLDPNGTQRFVWITGITRKESIISHSRVIDCG